jgi:hypothetical protein
MCSVAVNGTTFQPMIILPNYKFLPEEFAYFEEKCLFLSTDSGWMDRKSFIIWCHFFIYQLNHHRCTLPPHLRKERFLLLLDGHSSRNNFHAISLLKDHGVDTLIFPSHSTHLMQFFDGALASPLKVTFQKVLTDIMSKKQLKDNQNTFNTEINTNETWRKILIQ